MGFNKKWRIKKFYLVCFDSMVFARIFALQNVKDFLSSFLRLLKTRKEKISHIFFHFDAILLQTSNEKRTKNCHAIWNGVTVRRFWNNAELLNHLNRPRYKISKFANFLESSVCLFSKFKPSCSWCMHFLHSVAF